MNRSTPSGPVTLEIVEARAVPGGAPRTLAVRAARASLWLGRLMMRPVRRLFPERTQGGALTLLPGLEAELRVRLRAPGRSLVHLYAETSEESGLARLKVEPGRAVALDPEGRGEAVIRAAPEDARETGLSRLRLAVVDPDAPEEIAAEAPTFRIAVEGAGRLVNRAIGFGFLAGVLLQIFGPDFPFLGLFVLAGLLFALVAAPREGGLRFRPAALLPLPRRLALAGAVVAGFAGWWGLMWVNLDGAAFSAPVCGERGAAPAGSERTMRAAQSLVERALSTARAFDVADAPDPDGPERLGQLVGRLEALSASFARIEAQDWVGPASLAAMRRDADAITAPFTPSGDRMMTVTEELESLRRESFAARDAVFAAVNGRLTALRAFAAAALPILPDVRSALETALVPVNDMLEASRRSPDGHAPFNSEQSELFSAVFGALAVSNALDRARGFDPREQREEIGAATTVVLRDIRFVVERLSAYGVFAETTAPLEAVLVRLDAALPAKAAPAAGAVSCGWVEGLRDNLTALAAIVLLAGLIALALAPAFRPRWMAGYAFLISSAVMVMMFDMSLFGFLPGVEAATLATRAYSYGYLVLGWGFAALALGALTLHFRAKKRGTAMLGLAAGVLTLPAAYAAGSADFGDVPVLSLVALLGFFALAALSARIALYPKGAHGFWRSTAFAAAVAGAAFAFGIALDLDNAGAAGRFLHAAAIVLFTVALSLAEIGLWRWRRPKGRARRRAAAGGGGKSGPAEVETAPLPGD